MDEDPNIKTLADNLNLNSIGTSISVRGDDGVLHSINEIIEEQSKIIKALETLIAQKGISISEEEFQDIIDSIEIADKLV